MGISWLLMASISFILWEPITCSPDSKHRPLFQKGWRPLHLSPQVFCYLARDFVTCRCPVKKQRLAMNSKWGGTCFFSRINICLYSARLRGKGVVRHLNNWKTAMERMKVTKNTFWGSQALEIVCRVNTNQLCKNNEILGAGKDSTEHYCKK